MPPSSTIDPRIAEYLAGPLALRPDHLAVVAQMRPRPKGYGGGGGGGPFGEEAEAFTRLGRTAWLQVRGPMCFGCGDWGWWFGLCDTGHLSAALHDVAADDSIDTVLVEVDSPGGDVAGMADLVEAMDAVKAAGKRLVAVVHDMAYSAAYWLASQAEELYLTETGGLGSIGVFTVLYDESAAFAEAGVSVKLVASTPLKGVGVPGVGITDPQLAAEGEPVFELHRAFVHAVANGRGVSPEVVQGWALSADAVGAQAVERGMADGVVDFRKLIVELASTHTGASTMADPKKVAAAVKAAGKAAPKAEETDTTETDTDMEAMRARVAELEKENTDLKEKLDAEVETDTGEEEDEPEKEAATTHDFAAYKRAFEAAKIGLGEGARAFITESMEDEIPPKASAKAYAKIAAATGVSTAIQAAGESTAAVAGGPGGGGARAGGPAKVRWDDAIAKAKASGLSKSKAAEHVIRTNPGLREEMLEEVNAR